MKILVLATNYPDVDGNVSLMYIHTRNKFYVKSGIDVTVLNFSASESYIVDDVKVITRGEYETQINDFDILVSHAPNIRNHFLFLLKHGNEFKKIIFFYHGHEIVKLNVYPREYEYNKKSYLRKIVQEIYDTFKLKVWRMYLTKNIGKISLIFVSNNLYKEFLYWTQINPTIVESQKYIINNSVGEVFEKNIYDSNSEKEFDFITIRSSIDSSVYCLDIIEYLANMFPDRKFLVIGKGKYFEYNRRPENLTLISNYINHEKLLGFIDNAKCALMPTRRDTQGVMSCELATYGIPLITSHLEICHEIFEEFSNVKFIDNDKPAWNFIKIFEELMTEETNKNQRYFAKNTIQREVKIFHEIIANK